MARVANRKSAEVGWRFTKLNYNRSVGGWVSWARHVGAALGGCSSTPRFSEVRVRIALKMSGLHS